MPHINAGRSAVSWLNPAARVRQATRATVRARWNKDLGDEGYERYAKVFQGCVDDGRACCRTGGQVPTSGATG